MTAPEAAPLPTVKPGILAIAPYVGGKSTASGANRTIKLSSNENPLGPSPDAVEAYADAIQNLHLYPDGGATALRGAIAEAEGLDAARIVCGAGSDELISLLCQCYAGPGDTVMHSAHGFLMYRLSALGVGADVVAVPEVDLAADIDAMLAAATSETKIVFLANPNNPTGTLIADAEIRRLREGLPSTTLLVIDAAYAEYVDDPGYEAGARLVSEREDTVMTRTFSKVHGLAALRLGWCYAPPAIADALNRARGPFNVSAPALAAGEASIRDGEYIAGCVAENNRERARVAEGLAALGFAPAPSHGNFVLAHFGADGPRSAAAADEYLQSRGIVVRRMEGYGLPDYLRISIGRIDENDALLAALGAMPA